MSWELGDGRVDIGSSEGKMNSCGLKSEEKNMVQRVCEV